MKVYIIIENNNNTVIGVFESKEDAEASLPSIKSAFEKYDVTVEIEEHHLVEKGNVMEYELS